MGFVKSVGSSSVDSSIVSFVSRVRKSSFFLLFEEPKGRIRGTAAVETGFTRTV